MIPCSWGFLTLLNNHRWNGFPVFLQRWIAISSIHMTCSQCPRASRFRYSILTDEVLWWWPSFIFRVHHWLSSEHFSKWIELSVHLEFFFFHLVLLKYSRLRLPMSSVCTKKILQYLENWTFLNCSILYILKQWLHPFALLVLEFYQP